MSGSASCNHGILSFSRTVSQVRCRAWSHIAAVTACRPGDGALPSQYVPMGTQVGTPAWVPESADTDVDVAKNWFVIIKGSKARRATERDHVQMDTAGTNTVVATRGQPSSARSSHPTVSLGVAGERALALSAHGCPAHQQASCLESKRKNPIGRPAHSM